MDQKKLSCEEVLEQLSDYLDEDARAELCEAIEQHLSRCHDCQVEVDTIKKTILLYQADRVVEMPVALSHRLESALAKAYRQPPGPAD
ncbi:MAG: anti-sigma factor family protein [Candidatus Eisenbacteria bacterium]